MLNPGERLLMDRRQALVLIAHPLLAGAAAASAETPLQLRGDRVFLPARVQGHEVEVLLDSAAEMTLIDTAWARAIGLAGGPTVTAKGSGGEQPAAFSKGVSLQAAGVTLRGMTVALTDLQEVSQRLLGTSVRVILGREWFDAARWNIDLQGLRVRRLDRLRLPAGEMLALRSERGIEAIPVQAEGAKAWADLDIGNGGNVLIGRRFAQLRGLLAPGRIVARETGGGLGGAVERDVVVLRDLVVAGRRFENVRAAIDDQDTAGELNIGTRLLKHFEMTWDFARHRVWMRSHSESDD